MTLDSQNCRVNARKKGAQRAGGLGRDGHREPPCAHTNLACPMGTRSPPTGTRSPPTGTRNPPCSAPQAPGPQPCPRAPPRALTEGSRVVGVADALGAQLLQQSHRGQLLHQVHRQRVVLQERGHGSAGHVGPPPGTGCPPKYSPTSPPPQRQHPTGSIHGAQAALVLPGRVGDGV